MFRNYITVAFRSLSRQKGYAFINMAGLAIGLAAFALIMMYVHFHWSYDRFHNDVDRLYRIAEIQQWGPEDVHVAVTMGGLASALQTDLPEVESATRVKRVIQVLMQVGELKEYENKAYYVDPEFFDIFNFPFVYGSPETALSDPTQIIVSESFAEKYFGRTDVLGETILIPDLQEMKVSAVMQDPPANSHLRPNCILSWQAYLQADPNGESWYNNHLATYFKLAPGADIAAVDAKLPDFFYKYRSDGDDEYTEETRLYTQPILDMHLHTSDIKYDTNSDKSDYKVMLMFAAIAVGILLLACINFMNLSTARSIRRAREVGLRKVVGARRGQLILQYLGESLVMSLTALLPAIVIVELAAPYLKTLVGRPDINLQIIRHPMMLGALLVTALLVGIISGVYPAIVLSAFRPVSVLKGALVSRSKGALVRRSMVVAQFSLSIFLMIGTGIIMQQIHYLRNKPLGFEKDLILCFALTGEETSDRVKALTSELRRDQAVESLSMSNSFPGLGRNSSKMRPADTPEDRGYIINVNYVDENFIPTFGMEMVDGRNFDAALASDSMCMIVNETAYHQFGWETLDGKYVRFIDDKERPVIGVVKDYHFRSVSMQIEPLVLMFYTAPTRFINLKLSNGDIPATIERIEAIWDEVNPEYPFNYIFLDEFTNNQFETYKRAQGILMIFAGIAILIASLGLLGLASFMANRRTREFSIRKVLGASPISLISLISREFVLLLCVASMVAWGAAYVVAGRLLDTLPYHAPLHWSVFVGAAVLAMVFAIMTVAGQAARAASVNPADALRHE